VGTGLRVTDVQPGDVATNLIMKNTDEAAATDKNQRTAYTTCTPFVVDQPSY